MSSDPIRKHLETALQDSMRFYMQGRWFIGGVGAVALLGSLLREIYWLAAISVLAFGAMVSLMVIAERRTSNHPIRRVILDEPERVIRITHRKASSSSGAFPTHWLIFAISESERGLGLKFDEGVIAALAPFLAQHFVNATIEIPGFDPKRDAAQV